MAFQEGDQPSEFSRQISGGTRACLEGNYFLSPEQKKLCLRGISRGKLISVGLPEHRNLCLVDFQGELISVGPPNIKIGVQGISAGEN